MTITAGTIINDALTENGVLAEGESASGTMAAQCLRALNRMLDTLSTNQAFSYYAVLVSRALTGEASFTIGATGDVTGSRPIGIESAYVTRDGINYPVNVIDVQKFDGITYPAESGGNTVNIYYSATVPDGTVYCHPLATGCTLNMRVVNQVVNFTDLTTAITLPPGYEECIISNFKIRLASIYPVTLSTEAKILAKTTLSAIHRRNNVIPTLKLPAVLGHSGYSHSNFISGD